MGIASRKHHEKKLQINTINFSNDEMILYELQKHVDYYTLQNLMLKVYFNETDLSMDSGTKIWMNLIHPCFYPNYHSHDYYEFNIIFEGKCIEIINNHVVNLEKGDILILPANSAYHTHYLKKGGRGCNILVKSSYLTAIYDEISEIKDNFLERLLKKNGFCVIHTEACPDIAKDMEELLDIYTKENKTQAKSTPPSVLSRMYAESTFYRMILKICRGLENGDIICDFSDTVPKATSTEEIIMYIKDNHTTVTTLELSKKFGYSQRHLNRIIKKHTGSSFSTLVAYERIIHAKNLLKNTSLSVAEISKALGLDSKEYFCNLFKSQTGMTPSQYKKMARNTENE